MAKIYPFLNNTIHASANHTELLVIYYFLHSMVKYTNTIAAQLASKSSTVGVIDRGLVVHTKKLSVWNRLRG